MLNSLVVLLTALLFYFIGYYSGRYSELKETVKKVKRMLGKNKGMVIDYPTKEEIEYSGSEREKIDEQQTELIKKAGII